MDSILTVTTAADSQDIIAVATVESELGTPSSDRVAVERRITAISGAFAGHCNRVFIKETVSESFRDVRRRAAITLQRWPVSAVASVTEDDVALVAGTDYELDAAKGLLYRLSSGCRRHWWFRKLVVAYTGGYAIDDARLAPLQEAALRMIRSSWVGRDRDPMVRRESVPGVLDTEFWVGVIGEGGLPPDVLDLLAPFVETPL